MKHERIVAPATLVKRALGGHAALGLLAGAFMYLIALSGALIVVHHYLERWEQPGVAETTTIGPVAVQRALAAAIAADGKPTTHAYVQMPTAASPRAIVTTDHGGRFADAEGRLGPKVAHPFTEFLVNMHYYLHLPMSVGMIVVGAFGVMLAALAITGVVAHPRIFRDAFRLRPRGHRQLAHADWHNRLGVWTLPFVLALALTGAIIGLGSIGFQLIANERHGGTVEEAYEPLFGAHPPEDKRPTAALARADVALAHMARAFPQVRPSYVTLDAPQTRGQTVFVLAEHDRRLIYGDSYAFAGDGRFQHTGGMSDGALGKQFTASLYKLHFGNFGGLPVLLGYIAIGLALCVVTATGMSLWLMKRRARGMASPRLEGFWSGVVWGAPLLIVATLWLRAIAGVEAPLVAFFWSAFAALLVAAMVKPTLARPIHLRRALAVALALTAVGHALLTSTTLFPALVIDAATLATAATLFLIDRRRTTS